MKLRNILFYMMLGTPFLAFSMEAPILNQQSDGSDPDKPSDPTTMDILNKAKVIVSLKKDIENQGGRLVGPEISPTYSLKDPLHIFSLLENECLKTKELLEKKANFENGNEFLPGVNHLLYLINTYHHDLKNISSKNEIKLYIHNCLEQFQDAIEKLNEINQTSTVLNYRLDDLLKIVQSALSQDLKLGSGDIIPFSERFQRIKQEEKDNYPKKINELSNLPYTQSEAQMRLFPGGRGDGSLQDIENTLSFLSQQAALRRFFPYNHEILRQRLTEILDAEIRHRDKAVLYSAASNGNFSLIMLFTAMREILNLRAEKDSKTIRLLTPLTETIEKFYESIFDQGENDQGPTFARNGLSTSISFVDYHGTESALPFWLRNSNTRRNFGAKLQEVLKALGIEFNPNGNSSPLEEAFQEMAKYLNDFSGSLLQVFIDPSILDKVVWPAKPFGLRMEYQLTNDKEGSVPIKSLKDLIILLRTDPLSYYTLNIREEGQTSWSENGSVENPLFSDMQARLFIDPKILLNKKYVIIKDYFLKKPDPQNYRRYKQAVNKLAVLILDAYLKNQVHQEENIFKNDIDGSEYPFMTFNKVITGKGELLRKQG
ncbi:hypothetical protein [Candidatus Paracaedibacter symbiosus]|uniref:hypothetical protein n=1 Tax=Candidatus Paracaedibacter symbiosus TaxID=244582 RepID=UPI000509DB4C|nr:hypothetical protein [Candidatus Paracaedibacter symbiosus]